MDLDAQTSDPLLRKTLEVSAQARAQALATLEVVSTISTTPESSLHADLSKQQKLLYALLAQLRALHRNAQIGARETKSQTAEARQEIDRLHLHLQNLFYEQRHLQAEIVACEDYEYTESLWLFTSMLTVARHKYLQLPLVSVEQFLEEHPEHADADENALTIARIDHEHAERVKLEELRQGLLKKKQGLIADNKKRKEDLANLDKDLEKFIDVSVS